MGRMELPLEESGTARAAGAGYCKPEANEMYYRFKSFLNGGPRRVVPDVAGTDRQGIPVGASVEVHGLKAKPELNGQVGVILLFDRDAGRYEVQLGSGPPKRVRAQNLRLLREPLRREAAEGAPGEEEVLDVELDGPSRLPRAERAAVRGAEAEAPPSELGLDARAAVHGLSAPSGAGGAGEFVRDLGSTTEEGGQAAELRSSEPPPASLELEIAGVASASGVLALCKRRRAELTLVDSARALRRIASCPDRIRACSSSEMSELVELSRELLDARAAPVDVLDILGGLAECKPQAVPLLEDLAAWVLEHVKDFVPEAIVRILAGFSTLGHADVKLFDALADRLLGRVDDLTVSDCVEVACAFARARLRHFELLEELAERAAAGLNGLGEGALAAGVEAFLALEVPDGALLDAARDEASRRAGLFSLEELLQLAGLSEPYGGERWAAVAKALGTAAGRLVGSTEDLDFTQLTRLSDVFPQLRGRLDPRLLAAVRIAVAAVRGLEAGSPETLVAELRAACPHGLGVRGTRLALAEFGVHHGPASLTRRASNRISWARSAVEDWDVQTVRLRSFSFAEYRLEGLKVGALEGNQVCHDGARPSEPPPSLASPLLAAGLVSLDELCALSWVLCDVYRLASEAAGGDAAEADATAKQVASMTGSLQVCTMDPPGVAGLLLVGRIQSMMPRLKVSITVGAAVDVDAAASEVLDMDPDDEVIDAASVEEEEVMEAVD